MPQQLALHQPQQPDATDLYDSILSSQRGIVKIADFNVTTNTPDVTITASSTNGGQLEE
ncbi:MAG: hypothetical protein PT120_05680 [Aphanizomenon gracile PMC649.10]|nr:hypothetical protein [Aphanizomenon gracile PMC649.10]